MERQTPYSRLSIILLILLSLGAIWMGCSEDLGVLKENQPPSVWLSSAPPEGSVSKYSIHLYWGGWDPDGEILYYEYAITDNDSGVFNPADTVGADNWHQVNTNDSTFTVSADVLADTSHLSRPMDAVDFIRSHTFVIRALDHQGLSSEKPAYRSFTARTLSPTIKILIPLYNGLTPALLPPITRFTWEGKDYVSDTRTSQDPDSVRWILVSVEDFNDDYLQALRYIRQNPQADEWSDWSYYAQPNDSGTFWTTPPLDFGAYMFAVQAKDEAGAVTPVFDEEQNVRRVIISRRTTGPKLVLRNNFIGVLQTTVESVSFTIIDLPAGIDLEFFWQATAKSYGGVVAGYRYGWDVVDFSRDEQWAVDWTPFVGTEASSPPQAYYFGTHTFHVEVIDNSGFKSRINIKTNFIPFTMEKNLLLVDDYFEDPISSGLVKTNGAIPSDKEHDQFWMGVLNNLVDFNPMDDVVEVSPDFPLSIVKLARYKSLIWDTYGGFNLTSAFRPFLHDLIIFRPETVNQTIVGKVQPNLIALFLASGGHVFICGEQPMTTGINPVEISPRYPFIIQYEIGGDQDGNYANQVDNPVGDNSFLFHDMCLDVLEIAYTGWNDLRRPGATENGCGVTHVRRVRPVEDGLRHAIPIDIDMDFPALSLRPEVSTVGKFYSEASRGLNDELYNPPYFTCGRLDLGPRDCFEPIYGHGCLDLLSPLYDAPIATWTSVFESVVPDIPGGLGKRSVVWGFEPFFMDTTAVKQAIEKIIFDEWELPSK